MALFIRDARVEALVEEVRKATNARSKTEAVRNALTAQLASARQALPLSERLKRAQAMADELGPFDPNFDMKAFTDEMWGDV